MYDIKNGGLKMNIQKEKIKNEFFNSLKGKKHSLPKDVKQLHKLISFSQIVKNVKGEKLNKKQLCSDFGIAYHTPKLISKSLNFNDFKYFEAIPYTNEHTARELILK